VRAGTLGAFDVGAFVPPEVAGDVLALVLDGGFFAAVLELGCVVEDVVAGCVVAVVALATAAVEPVEDPLLEEPPHAASSSETSETITMIPAARMFRWP
jgi:hypothetical protein